MNEKRQSRQPRWVKTGTRPEQGQGRPTERKGRPGARPDTGTRGPAGGQRDGVRKETARQDPGARRESGSTGRSRSEGEGANRRFDRAERGVRADRTERTDRAERTERTDRRERPVRSERPERVGRVTRPDRQDFGARRESGNRPDSRRRFEVAEAAPRGGRVGIRLEQLRQVLDLVLNWQQPADVALSRWFKENARLGSRDRGELAEGLYDTLRHLRRYRQMATSGHGTATRRLAILGLSATLGSEALEEALDMDERAWLEHVGRIDPQSQSRAVRHSLPDWLDEKIGALVEPEALAQALNQPAPLDLRVNPLKAERDAMMAVLQAQLGELSDKLTATPYSPWGMRLDMHLPLNRWSQFTDGQIEVQDEGSQLLALMVGPKRQETVVDFCAGAGGKTLLLGALMRSTGRLYAMDVSAARLANAKPRLARSGLSNVIPIALSSENDTRVKRLSGKAHRVLVDAPCSGTGTLRRNPDLKWRQTPESLAALVDIQARILHSAARCVAPGGRLVYATCSILPDENEAQIEAFLAQHPDFELLDAREVLGDRVPALVLDGPYLSLRPDVHGTDGFFAAALQRKAAA